MTDAGLDRIDKTIEIAAPPERVWRALTDPKELSAWFQVIIEGAIAPDTEIWMTSTHAGYEGQRFRVRIGQMIRPKHFSWHWHPGVVDPNVDYSREPRTTVTFTLEPLRTGTRLTVSETGFEKIILARRAKVFEDNKQGWGEVLGWLQAHAEKTR